MTRMLMLAPFGSDKAKVYATAHKLMVEWNHLNKLVFFGTKRPSPKFTLYKYFINS